MHCFCWRSICSKYDITSGSSIVSKFLSRELMCRVVCMLLSYPLENRLLLLAGDSRLVAGECEILWDREWCGDDWGRCRGVKVDVCWRGGCWLEIGSTGDVWTVWRGFAGWGGGCWLGIGSTGDVWTVWRESAVAQSWLSVAVYSGCCSFSSSKIGDGGWYKVTTLALKNLRQKKHENARTRGLVFDLRRETTYSSS